MSKTIAEIIAEMEAEREQKLKNTNSQRTELAKTFFEKGYALVRIEFAGSGDSGNIDDITITMKDGEPTSLEYSSPERNEIEDWAQVYLEGTNVDWYNNDGGQGYIEFDLTTAPWKFEASIDQNETVSSNAHFEQDAA